LINEANSLFSLSDFTNQRKTTFQDTNFSSLKNRIKKRLPSLSLNVKGEENYKTLVDLLLQHTDAPRVLIVGGGIVGEGMQRLINNPKVELVETDVTFAPRTQLICDGHDLSFDDQSFDCVIVQAVLEHVLDPHRCVAEIHRVLKPQGFVYAETPFMQQVHMGRYDFTRFTYLGHRRLFRYFSEIESGAVCGPGMALGWSYQHFLLSFAKHRRIRQFLFHFSNFTGFFWKYFDHIILNTPAGLDAASGYYFMGQRSEMPISDRELIQLYRGAQ
jgi:SAM-dependent methyltransferase